MSSLITKSVSVLIILLFIVHWVSVFRLTLPWLVDGQPGVLQGKCDTSVPLYLYDLGCVHIAGFNAQFWCIAQIPFFWLTFHIYFLNVAHIRLQCGQLAFDPHAQKNNSASKAARCCTEVNIEATEVSACLPTLPFFNYPTNVLNLYRFMTNFHSFVSFS